MPKKEWARGEQPGSTTSPVDDLNDLMFSSMTDHSQARWRRYFAPVPALSEGLPAPILGIMVLIWQLRANDLGQAFSLKTRDSRLGFMAWCIVHGRNEYVALRQAAPFWHALRQPTQFAGRALPNTDPGHAISVLMQVLVLARPDLQVDLATRAGRQKLLLWYLLHGRVELGFGDAPLENWQTAYLFSPSATAGLNCLQELVHRERADVQKIFPLPVARSEYIAWFRHFVTEQAGLLDALRIKKISDLMGDIDHIDGGISADGLDFGVNIIGYAYGQLGIGEDARMAGKALLAAAVPMTMLDFSPGDGIPNGDKSMAAHVGPVAKYAINVFCMTAMEHGRYLAEKGTDYMTGHYNIGYWPWELGQWPQAWRHLLSLVDEVWVSSRHTYSAICGVSPVRVRLMPMAVESLSVSKRSRADFSLPASATLFLFAFDLNSSAKRKNPKACVAAFMAAFPAVGNTALGPDQVGLVIKVHPPKSQNHEWDLLKKLQKTDRRIHLIEETLTKADLLALYSVCDCFVSLHRAEGFGRCIAEAMLLAKPVITTGFSGNLDFSNEDNSLLVRYRLIPLALDDYPFGEGQFWAEPDPIDAVRQMKRIKEEPWLGKKLGFLGQKTIKNNNNLRSIGRCYANALGEIRMHYRYC